MQGNAKNAVDFEHEVVLSGFGGVGYNCTKAGHKTSKCPENKNKVELSRASATIVAKLAITRLIDGKRKETWPGCQQDTNLQRRELEEVISSVSSCWRT
jgi:hypothetical protein